MPKIKLPAPEVREALLQHRSHMEFGAWLDPRVDATELLIFRTTPFLFQGVKSK